jgi:hypothetical protein
MSYGLLVRYLIYVIYADGGSNCYAHILKAKRIKDFSYKSHIGYLAGYTTENGYLAYV